MTAEIVVMNKEGIALAADSAVTHQGEGAQKVFHTANKIFALSKYEPVGVMVYGSASFMGVPWETIVKTYRRQLRKRRFPHLGQYATDLRQFLARNRTLFPAEQQHRYAQSHIYGYLRYFIRREIDEQVKDSLARQGPLSDSDVRAIASRVVSRYRDSWRQARLVVGMTNAHRRRVLDKYANVIRRAKKQVFENLLTSGTSRKVTQIVADYFVKFAGVSPDSSGVVVAGFGTRDVFPALAPCMVDGIVLGKMRFRKEEAVEISFDNSASIVPFAQGEMVSTFMEGVNPEYQRAIEADFSEVVRAYGDIVVDSIDALGEQAKTKLKRSLKDIRDKSLGEYYNRLEGHRKDKYVSPVLDVLAMLPKDELAAMAEALVDLTRFRQRVTKEAETVAGPIDVAVISKGDGLIWMKRKHYFAGELNPQFFANYYREGGNG